MPYCPVYADPEDCPEHGPGCIDDCPPLMRLAHACDDPACTLCALYEEPMNPFGTGDGNSLVYRNEPERANPPALDRLNRLELIAEIRQLSAQINQHPEHATQAWQRIGTLIDLLNADQ